MTRRMQRTATLGVSAGVMAVLLMGGLGCADRQETYAWSHGPMAHEDGAEIHLLAITTTTSAMRLRLELVNLGGDDLVCVPVPAGQDQPSPRAWLTAQCAQRQVSGQIATEVVEPFSSDQGYQHAMQSISDRLVLPGHSSRFIDADFHLSPAHDRCWLIWHVQKKSDTAVDLTLDITMPAAWKQPQRMSDSNGPLP